MTNPLDRRHANAAAAPAAPAPREGFALPMVILVIAFLTVTIAAAYAATSSELTTNTAQRGESRAYMIAQAGLENFMARRNEAGFCANCGAPPTTTYESTTVLLPGGYAQVVAQQVRTANNSRPAIYLLRSRGVDTVGIVTGSAIGARAERLVAQLVYWNVNQVNVLSGWTATNGLNKQGSSGTITGHDECGQKADVAGIAVPSGDFSTNGNFNPIGDPPIKELGTQEQTNASVKIDWNGIVNGTRIQADFTFASNDEAQAAWPSIDFNNKYPVIRVNGNFSLPLSGGQGTLIVLGTLDMDGNNLWKGILMVGGQMTSNGNGTMSGATMSGLNTTLTPAQFAQAQLISSVPLSSNPDPAIANGTKTFTYNSCEVSKAAGGLASYSVYPNAWMDNFVTY
jgi:hypothetical protein